MDRNSIFTTIQEYLANIPLLLIGTGGTIPYGIPGMPELATYLRSTLNDKYVADTSWKQLKSRLVSGTDLESALTHIEISETLKQDIILETWEFISKYDFKLLNKLIEKSYYLPLGILIHKLCQTSSQQINIVTTNYDRVIEYACDQQNIYINTFFSGTYIKYIAPKLSCNFKPHVNLLKVHGSLDWFINKNGQTINLPLQAKIPNNYTSAIITPGTEKYRDILTGPCTIMFHNANDYISNANCYLCIGYGFNDDHIQNYIIEEIKKNKPIVVVTKKISSKSIELLENNSNKYVIIQEDPNDNNNTEFIINKKHISLLGKLWEIGGFMRIIS